MDERLSQKNLSRAAIYLARGKVPEIASCGTLDHYSGENDEPVTHSAQAPFSCRFCFRAVARAMSQLQAAMENFFIYLKLM